MLDASTQAEILRLHFSQGLSRRQISDQLRVNRKSVARILNRRAVVTGNRGVKQRASMLEPYYERIKKMLEDAPSRTCVNMLQQLREAGYQGGITVLKDYVSTIRPGQSKRAFFELDFAPGEAAQVDWGEFGDVFGNGTKVHAFVMVHCWSRMLYVEFTFRENLPALLRCYERALRFFGGRCREYWHDNMSTVVTERWDNLIRLNTGFLAYAGFHGFKPILCHRAAGWEKGRVEDGVKLVRHQFWPGRKFSDMDDLNQQAGAWRDQYANRRIHRATGKVPELMMEAEREVLLPLRSDPYDTDDVASTQVTKFCRVRFEGNTYTVPWTLVGKTMTVRGDDRLVRVFYGHKRVTEHERRFQKGLDIVNPRHIAELKDFKAGASRTWEIEAVKSFGPFACRYLELIAGTNRSLRAEVKELLCLATVYGRAQVEETIGKLIQQGAVGVNLLERALRLSEHEPKAPPPLEFASKRLKFVPPAPALDSYNSLLMESEERDDEEFTAEKEPEP